MSSSGEFRPGDVVADRYVIEALLGQSPAARIYLADENHSRRKLCLKIYRPEIAANCLLCMPDFFQRAGAWPALAQDNLAAVYAAQETEGLVCVAREFLEGPGFDAWARNPQATQARGLELIWQAAQGLVFLHDQSLHLNLHPGNVLVGGLTAKIVDPDPRFLTPQDLIPMPIPVRDEYRGYLAPEMRRGGSLAYPSTDLYGLAGMFFFLLTGSHPPENHADLRRRLDTGMSRTATDFLIKALHPDPEQRFTDAETFADALWAQQPALPSGTPPEVASGTLFGQTPAVRKTEIMSPAASASMTLFGETPDAAFVEPKAISTPKRPAVRAPLSSLETPVAEEGATLFGSPIAFKPAPAKGPVGQVHLPPSGNTLFSSAPKIPPATVPPATAPSTYPSAPPQYASNPSPKSAASLSSLEMDSADLTLSGGAPGLTRYGFTGAGSNQTLALEAAKRRRSHRVLLIAMIAAALIVFALAGLLIVLKTSAKKNTATATLELPGAKMESPSVPTSAPPAPASTPAAVPAPPADVSASAPETAPAPQPAASVPPEAKNPASSEAPAPVSGARVKPPVEDLLRIVKAQSWPTSVEDCLQLGDDLNDYGRTSEANAAYSQALGMSAAGSENKVHALGGLAVTFNKMGMKEEARNAVDQLLALQPGNRFAKNLKAQLAR